MTKKNARLRERMREKRYNQGHIAKILDIGEKTVSLKMRGLCPFKWSEVLTICKVLNIKNPIGWFE